MPGLERFYGSWVPNTLKNLNYTPLNDSNVFVSQDTEGRVTSFAARHGFALSDLVDRFIIIGFGLVLSELTRSLAIIGQDQVSFDEERVLLSTGNRGRTRIGRIGSATFAFRSRPFLFELQAGGISFNVPAGSLEDEGKDEHEDEEGGLEFEVPQECKDIFLEFANSKRTDMHAIVDAIFVQGVNMAEDSLSGRKRFFIRIEGKPEQKIDFNLQEGFEDN